MKIGDKLKMNKKDGYELLRTINETLKDIKEESLNNTELDNILLGLFNFFNNFEDIDSKTKNEIKKTIQELQKVKDKTKAKKLRESKLKKIQEYKAVLENTSHKQIHKNIDKEVEERLYKHFNNKTISEAVKTKEPKEDTEFEVDKKFEQNLLLAIINSSIADQSDINRIKSLSRTTTLTKAIKQIIPKKFYKDIKQLVKIQEQREKEFNEAYKRLIK